MTLNNISVSPSQLQRCNAFPASSRAKRSRTMPQCATRTGALRGIGRCFKVVMSPCTRRCALALTQRRPPPHLGWTQPCQPWSQPCARRRAGCWRRDRVGARTLAVPGDAGLLWLPAGLAKRSLGPHCGLSLSPALPSPFPGSGLPWLWRLFPSLPTSSHLPTRPLP